MRASLPLSKQQRAVHEETSRGNQPTMTQEKDDLEILEVVEVVPMINNTSGGANGVVPAGGGRSVSRECISSCPAIAVSAPSKSEKTDDSKSDAVSELSVEDTPDRANWGGQLEFIFTCIGYAVGLGNVWRFPYLCYKNGGGAFLIPYTLMLLLVGLPLFFMELALGQFASLGPISIWRINPLLKGLGYGMVIVSWLISLYYNVIISHVLFYLVSSFTASLPWVDCGNWWNTNSCLAHNFTLDLSNGTSNETETPSEQYYKYFVLEQSESIEEFGSISWKLLIALFVAWLIVCVCLLRGIQSLGKVVYFTAIFPYIMLTILLIRGLTLEGAMDGVIYYLKPDFSRLKDPRVWCDAATQIFYSLSACTGGLIAMASFNKFNNNCYRDALIVSLINCGTSLYSGFVIFSILGFMANEKGVPVSEVAAGGPGLAFVVYPEAISRMPVSPLWAIFFFIMMATLGFGSQFSIVECVLSAVIDEFPNLLRDKIPAIIFRCSVIGISFVLGLPMICKGGIFLLNLVDYSVGGFPLLVIGLLELIAINYIYGFQQFSLDIEMMLGHRPNIYWRVCWKYLSPLVIFVTIVFNIVLYKNPDYEEKPYPEWALAVGWLIAFFPITVVIVWFCYTYCKWGGFLLLKENMAPLPEWGPAAAENRTDRYDLPEEPEHEDVLEHFLGHRAAFNIGLRDGPFGRPSIRKLLGSNTTINTQLAGSFLTINGATMRPTNSSSRLSTDGLRATRSASRLSESESSV